MRLLINYVLRNKQLKVAELIAGEPYHYPLHPKIWYKILAADNTSFAFSFKENVVPNRKTFQKNSETFRKTRKHSRKL